MADTAIPTPTTVPLPAIRCGACAGRHRTALTVAMCHVEHDVITHGVLLAEPAHTTLGLARTLVFAMLDRDADDAMAAEYADR